MYESVHKLMFYTIGFFSGRRYYMTWNIIIVTLFNKKNCDCCDLSILPGTCYLKRYCITRLLYRQGA